MANVTQRQPHHGRSSDETDPNWVTVDSSLYRGQHLTYIDGKLDAPYPLPEGCTREWRALVIRNDYDEQKLVWQARKAA